MPLQATSGAASYDAFGGGAAAVPQYIEDVFSTYLYTGNGSTQTITNGIDLSTKGGLVWIKSRSSGSEYHVLQDTVRGRGHVLSSNTTDQSFSSSAGESITTYNSNGFSLGINRSATQAVNTNAATYVSWTFREQPKFFDVVTYTGDGLGKTIPHNLGSTPGCILIKRTDAAAEWRVFHRSLNDQYLVLNSTAARVDMSGATLITCTSTTFYVGENAALCANGGTYVAYLFAHDAGGFGLTGTDNVISCGSFTASMGSLVNIGFEPQFVLIKRTDTSSVDDWLLFDNMRGLTMGDDSLLNPNTSGAENNSLGNNYINPQPTGFTQIGFGSGTYIYIAIRRGPMKVPTSGTSVFDTQLGVSSTTATISSGFVTDAALALSRPNGASGYGRNIYSRLQGNFQSMNTTKTDGEATAYNDTTISFDQNNGIKLNGGSVYNANWVYEQFKRAPSFFDVVCYLGTGSTQNVTHNLGVIPGFIVCKRRNGTANWCALAGTSNGTYESLYLNTTVGTLYTAPSAAVAGLTATTFNPQAVFPSEVNTNGDTYVAYLFATCAGVSKVFSYTGNGSSQTINCGFTGGARWILIKRTDSTGDWYVWDSARGIVSGNDPHLSLNSTAAEVTTDDTIDTDSTGFVVNQLSATNVNVSSATYIGLAIA